MFEFLAKSIMQDGHENNFSITERWLAQHALEPRPVVEFIQKQNIDNDWDVLINGDPYSLFGETDDRLSWMPLEKAELSELIEYLEYEVNQKGCKHDYGLARQWLKKRGKDSSLVLAASMAKGGGCDCEIFYNIELDSIYPVKSKSALQDVLLKKKNKKKDYKTHSFNSLRITVGIEQTK